MLNYQKLDDEINEGDTFGSVESVKLYQNYMHQSLGKVVEVNEELEDSPEFVNESPYEKSMDGKSRS